MPWTCSSGSWKIGELDTRSFPSQMYLYDETGAHSSERSLLSGGSKSPSLLRSEGSSNDKTPFYFWEGPLKIGIPGLLWWPSSWESVCQFKRHRFGPCCRKIPHATDQQSLSVQFSSVMQSCPTIYTATVTSQLSRAFVLQLLKPTCPWIHALPQEKPQQWEIHTAT